jgi:uncharacterized protein YdhG (YjbR/CyaY superfamily)
MPKKEKSVDAYLEGLTRERRAALEQLRVLIFKTVPDAEESMKYNMPTYDYAGEGLCAMASQKNYISLYMDFDSVAEHSEELSHLNVGKSCIRFTKIEKLPLDTVEQILKETVAKI